MNIEKLRKGTMILLLAGMVCIALAFITFWNKFPHSEKSVGYLPLLFSLCSIAALIILYVKVYRATDSVSFNGIIDTRVADEKNRLLSELKKNDEKQKTTSEIEDNIQLTNKIIPQGNFKKIDNFGKKLLVNLANSFNLVQGIMYSKAPRSKKFTFLTGFGLTNEEPISDFNEGEGLNGEVAKSQEIMFVTDIPENYFEVESGLGKGQPGSLILIPIVLENKTISVLELASFSVLDENKKQALGQIAEAIAQNLNQLTKA